MPRKVVKGTTENLNMLNEKVEYIGFKLGEVPEFLKEFEPLNYRVPKIYDETTYKIYKYVPVNEIEIMITPTNRLEELEERYKVASPLFTYMKAETNDDLEKYAHFLKMINQTKIEDIEAMEQEQTQMQNKIPFEVKFPSNFKWQIFYSEYAKKYFMLASTNETDNSQLFYLLKKKIESNKDKRKKPASIFVPISNETYIEKILKQSDIADLENYLWYFTKNWPSIYEVTDKKGEISLHIVGETPVYDSMTSKYKLEYAEKQEAVKEYKLIKALFILSYDITDEYKFDTKLDAEGRLIFYYKNNLISYENLADFLNAEAYNKIKQNVKIKLETKDLKADIKDLQKHSEEQNEEYLAKERQIYNFLECKKTFLGKVRYFFKSKKLSANTNNVHSISKERMKDILTNDKEKEKLYQENMNTDKAYTVEDIIKICKELDETIKENKNVKLDIKALQNKVENLDRKIKNATQYINEIEKHKKSIFAFWKFANKDEVKTLGEGEEETEERPENLKKTFKYEDDISVLANAIDKQQRSRLDEKELNATFAANFVLNGINILSKEKTLKSDDDAIEKILDNLKIEYKANIDKMEKKDFDIFGNVSEDKTKIKTLNNNAHRESEKDKFKILNVKLDTHLEDFKNKLLEIKSILENESNKIETPYDLSLYKVSNEKLEDDSFNKFNLNPDKVLEELEKIVSEEKVKDIYLYKINIPEKTNIIFYSNIVFYENNNGTLPLGMDISQETLINMDLYKLKLKNKDEFNINVCENEFEYKIQNVKVYEYDIEKKETTEAQQDDLAK